MQPIQATIAIVVVGTCIMWATPSRTQSPIVGCVELAAGVLPTAGDTARRKSTRTRSSRTAAINAARSQSRKNAATDLGPFCIGAINTAIATNACAALGRFQSVGSLIVPPVGRANLPPVSAQIGFDRNIVACAIVRDLDETTVEHLPGNQFRATFYSRASCGVKCTRP